MTFLSSWEVPESLSREPPPEEGFDVVATVEVEGRVGVAFGVCELVELQVDERAVERVGRDRGVELDRGRVVRDGERVVLGLERGVALSCCARERESVCVSAQEERGLAARALEVRLT